MRIRSAAILALACWLTGCDSILDAEPSDELPEDRAITNAEGARSALAGAYHALTESSYFADDFVTFGDFPADNADHIGSFSSYAEADANQVVASNASIKGIWDAIYIGINRVNVILERVPPLTDLEETEKNQILGEAHFLRALHYHNLVKLWGDVPIRLIPVRTVEEAAQISRSSVADVYTQVHADLDQAELLITNTEPATQATVGAAKALRARVYLYQQDWANALAKADEVIELDYELAPEYGELFDEEGLDTSEDILKLVFNATLFHNVGWYYNGADNGGREELAPSQDLIDAYEPDDARFAWSIVEDGPSGIKFPTSNGTEDIHVIRLAEVLLIKAEAQARLNDLAGAVDTYNPLRERSGLAPHDLGSDVTTQEEVLAAIDQERRVELAMEGDRWADLVRTGRAVEVLEIPEFQTLYPIPQAEIDVVPGLTQNPGY